MLYGTSYGTKVALDYAERYPQHVEALVLDSVVPAGGEEPFQITTFQAIPGVLEELCADRACAGITSNPVTDLARLVALLRRHPLSGSVYDGAGHRHSVSMSEVDLLDVLEAGDLNPALRALLPAAVRSALRSDPDPLLRLDLLAEGLIPSLPAADAAARSVATAPATGASARAAAVAAASQDSSELDQALFTTTTCEETPFPWQRFASASTRLSEARSALHGEPAAAFYPFDATTAFYSDLLPICAYWPDAAPAPPAAGPLPDVPTLLLSGAQDLRTPTANARAVAAQIPDAQLEVVPFTGHSVLGSDLSGCAATAVSTFFGGGLVQPCRSSTDEFAPTPLTPTRLAYVTPPSSFGGRPGKTLVAVLDTLVDLNRQVISATIEANQALPSGASFGGLRGGYARLNTSTAILSHFSFVPGVELSGTIPVREGQLQTATIHIGGRQAAAGTVRIGSGFKQVTGSLGGRRFSVSIAKVRLSSTGGGEWPTPARLRRLLDRPGVPAGDLGGLSPQLP